MHWIQVKGIERSAFARRPIGVRGVAGLDAAPYPERGVAKSQ